MVLPVRVRLCVCLQFTALPGFMHHSVWGPVAMRLHLHLGQVGPWTACPVPCGQTGPGVRTRQVWCVDGGAVVSSTFCAAAAVPSAAESCESTPCKDVFWSAEDEWGPCLEPCGLMGVAQRAKPAQCMALDQTGTLRPVGEDDCIRVQLVRCHNPAATSGDVPQVCAQTAAVVVPSPLYPPPSRR